MVSLKVAVISPSTGAHDVALGGDVARTAGGVVSGRGIDVNDHATGAASAFPEVSVTPVVMVAVYVVEAESGPAGVKVARRLE